MHSLDKSISSIVAILLVALLSIATSSRADTMKPTNQFFDSGPQAALEIAIRTDDLGRIADALAHGASVNARGRFDITPLMVAVDAQRLRAVQALLKAGALPNALARDGNGAVSLAVKSYLAQPHGRAIMLAVLEGGGNPDTRQPDGDPVLMRFVYDHDLADLALMKRLGANLDILDRGGDPLITKLAMAQSWDVVWTFIELGAQADYEHGKSRQPLSLALSGDVPVRDSPLYAYKRKVWQFLKDKGVEVPPMSP